MNKKINFNSETLFHFISISQLNGRKTGSNTAFLNPFEKEKGFWLNASQDLEPLNHEQVGVG